MFIRLLLNALLMISVTNIEASEIQMYFVNNKKLCILEITKLDSEKNSYNKIVKMVNNNRINCHQILIPVDFKNAENIHSSVLFFDDSIDMIVLEFSNATPVFSKNLSMTIAKALKKNISHKKVAHNTNSKDTEKYRKVAIGLMIIGKSINQLEHIISAGLKNRGDIDVLLKDIQPVFTQN